MGSAQSLFVSTYSVDESFVTQNFFFKFYSSAVSKLNKERVSIFVHQVTSAEVATLLSSGLKTLRKLRHPNLIKFVAAQEDSDGLTLVTQQVIPLQQVKAKLSEDDVCVGLYSLLNALIFLKSAGFHHAKLEEASIFVSPEDLKWKLGNAEFILAASEVTREKLEKIDVLLLNHASDKQKSSSDSIAASASMAHSFYTFVLRIVIPLIKNMRKTLILPWGRLEDSISKEQSLDDMMSLSFFKSNTLINMERSLLDFRLLSVDEKVDTFQRISKELYLITTESVERYILPLVLDIDFFAEFGCSPVYESLCSFSTLSIRLLPFFESALKSKRTEVRVNYLKVLPCFLRDLTPAYLHHGLIPEVFAGLEEEDDELYVHSLRALSILIPYSIESYGFFSNSSEGKAKPIIGPIRMTDAVITHVLKNSVAGLQMWEFIDILTSLWRSIITVAIVQKSKSIDLPLIFRQLAKTHHTLLQAMSSEQKVDFFSNRLVSKRFLMNEETVDGNTSWISRAIELVTPYLRDENQMVRKAAAASITQWISIIDGLYEGIPTISKSSRNAEQSLSKLKEVYPLPVRVKKGFTRSIQRRASRLSPEVGQESIQSTPKTPYIDRTTLNAQRQASYNQAQEYQTGNSEESPGLYLITELTVTSASTESLSDLYQIKDRSRRPTDEDIDLDLSHVKI